MTLHEYITANLRKPFVWGEFDCVLFAVGWLKIATGVDYIADLPKWNSEKQALRVIKRVGGLEKAIDTKLKRINPNLAGDGDVALYNGCMCLFSGAYIIGPNKGGLERIDRTKAECAWSY